MSVPRFLTPYLASYNLKKLDLIRDKEVIITEILNKGDSKSLKWLTDHYTKNEIKNIVSSPLRGSWLKNVLKYWQKIFELDLTPEEFNKAVINLNV